MSVPLESILKEIQSQTKDTPASAVEELNLDTLDILKITPELQNELEKFTNLMLFRQAQLGFINLFSFI